MSEDLIVESKVVAGDDINTGILLDSPMCETESLCLGEEVGLGDFASPVCLCCLLQVTVDSHTRETEDGSAIGRDVSTLSVRGWDCIFGMNGSE